MTLTINGIPISEVSADDRRLNMLIWGMGGIGKTVLASTAPKPILFLMFDPDGELSITPSKDIMVMKLYKISEKYTDWFKALEGIIYGDIQKAIKSEGIESIVGDSLTEYSHQSLLQGIKVAARNANKGKPATIEMPGFQGYGVRTTYTHQLMGNLLTATADTLTNCIFIAHIKSQYQKAADDTQELVGQTISLGGDMPTNVLRRVSECWYMSRDPRTGTRIIYPRSTLIPGTAKPIQPCKTRMFEDTLDCFNWNYNQVTDKGHKLSDWFDTWKREGKKLNKNML